MNVTDWLDAAKARSDAATDGPWTAADSVDGFSASVHGPRGCVAAARSTPNRELGFELGPLQPGRRREDAEFIAAARTDLPKALDALRALLDAAAISERHMYMTLTTQEIRNIIATALGVTP